MGRFATINVEEERGVRNAKLEILREQQEREEAQKRGATLVAERRIEDGEL